MGTEDLRNKLISPKKNKHHEERKSISCGWQMDREDRMNVKVNLITRASLDKKQQTEYNDWQSEAEAIKNTEVNLISTIDKLRRK